MDECEALEKQIELIRDSLIKGDMDTIRDSLDLWGII